MMDDVKPLVFDAELGAVFVVKVEAFEGAYDVFVQGRKGVRRQAVPPWVARSVQGRGCGFFTARYVPGGDWKFIGIKASQPW
jgi:hypothetical protein